MDAAVAFAVGLTIGVLLGFLYAALVVAAHDRDGGDDL